MKLPLVAVACLVLAGCSSGGTDHVVVTVDHADVLADQAVHLTVTGLKPHAQVSVDADAVDRDGKKWHADASFTADDHGTIDLDAAKPSRGSYQGADGMGLLWSMNPPDGDPDRQSYLPPLDHDRPVEHVDILVRKDSKDLARTTLTRQWLSPGVTHKPVSLTNDKILGTYVAPRPDHGVSGPPYLPHGTSIVHPVTGRTSLLGGTRAANESAQRQGWTKVLALLESLS